MEFINKLYQKAGEDYKTKKEGPYTLLS